MPTALDNGGRSPEARARRRRSAAWAESLRTNQLEVCAWLRLNVRSHGDPRVMRALGQAQQFARRRPPAPHRQLRGRALSALVLVGIVDLIGTLLMWLFEDEASQSEIHNLWDALFFSTVQLLTVSSQMSNPVTTGGRIVDSDSKQ
jgi:hypothetical protein